METTGITGILGWVFGVLAVSIISLITGIYSVIRTSKMIKRDVRQADLDNEVREADVAKIYKSMAADAALEAVEFQNRLSILEGRVEEQRLLIKQQILTITEQTKRLDLQEDKIAELRLDLKSTREYSLTLIEQMKKEDIVPLKQTKPTKKEE